MMMLWTCAMSFTALFLFCQFSVDTWAKQYPEKSIRLVVPSSAGGGMDTSGRIFAAGLTEVLGQQVIVDNRAGASGNIGAELVAMAPPDGYTLLHGSSALTANPSIFRNLSYDLVRDFTAISMLISQANLIVVNPSLPVKSIGDLVRLAKARPGAINYGSAGVGTASFVSVEIFKEFTGINLLHVPYKGGGRLLIGIIGGEAPVACLSIGPAFPHIQSGKLRVLAVTSSKRSPMLPEYPTVAESGYPGYEFEVRVGLLAPAQTPKETIATIHAAAIAALKSPTVRKGLAGLGYVAIGNQPEEFAAQLKSETIILRNLLRKLGVAAN